jgi:hypothetical protein
MSKDFPEMEYKSNEQIELAPHEDELHFWDKIMRSVRQPMARRMKAAELRAQYRHPRIGVVATASMTGEDFASLLDRAIARSGKSMKLIEHQPAPPPEPPTPPSPNPRYGPTPDRRFRRQ